MTLLLLPDQKFSTFAVGGGLVNGDIVVGLRGGINTQFTWNSSSGGVNAITGTQFQVLVNGSFGTPVTGSITLTLPQDIAPTSSPTFEHLTLTNPLGGASGGTGIDNGTQTINLGAFTTGYVLTSDVSGNASWQPNAGGGGQITTINGDSGSAAPVAGVVSITGGATGLTTLGSGALLSLEGTLLPGFGGTGLTTSGGPARYVVSTVVGQGGFTTVQAAINQAVTDGASISTPASIWIFPGTYTENLTLQPYVFLSCANHSDNETSTTVIGNAIFTGTGDISIDNISFVSNSSSAAISFQGGSSGVVDLNQVTIDGAGSGIGFECTSGSIIANLRICSLFAQTLGKCLNISNGAVALFNCSGSSTGVASTISAGSHYIIGGTIADGYNISGGTVIFESTNISATGLASNPAAITIGASGAARTFFSNFISNAASGFCIDGTGSLAYSGITFDGSATKINPTLSISQLESTQLAPVAQYVVSKIPGQGNFSTIQAAINAAISGGASSGTPATVWIFAGTYTENLTLAPWVNLASAQAPNSSSLIIGNAVYAGTGNASIENLGFSSSNASPAFSFQSSGTSQVQMNNCFLDGGSAGGTAVSCSAVAGSLINLYECQFSVNGTGQIFNITSANVVVKGGYGGFNPATPVASTVTSTGALSLFNTNLADAYSVTNASVSLLNSALSSATLSAFTLSGTSSVGVYNSVIRSNAGSGFMIDGTGSYEFENIAIIGTAINVNPTLTVTGNQSTFGKIITVPPASQTSSLNLGTAFQNTLGYDVVLTVYLSVATATTASILLGVGPTSTPTQQTIVNGLTVAAITIIPVTIYLPNNYYALLSASGTISVSTSGQMIMPV